MSLTMTEAVQFMESASCSAIALGRALDLEAAVVLGWAHPVQPEGETPAGASEPHTDRRTAHVPPLPERPTIPPQAGPSRSQALAHAGRQDAIAALVAILEKEPDISGAETGRRLGISERTGQRLLVLAHEELEIRRAAADT